MTVQELTREQLIQVKQDYLTQTSDCVSYGEFAAADKLVSDETVFSEYIGVDFSEEDFW